jgi:predicted GNAT family acetyltransferase
MPQTVHDDPERRRFELDDDGHRAFVESRRSDGIITMTHTEVPKPLEGRGVGSMLVRGALDLTRQRGLKVLPRCPFVKAFIERHVEYTDLVK